MRPLAVLLTGLKTMTILEEVKMKLDAWVAVGKDVESFPEPFGSAFLQILGAIIAGLSAGSVDLNQSQPSLLPCGNLITGSRKTNARAGLVAKRTIPARGPNRRTVVEPKTSGPSESKQTLLVGSSGSG